MWRNEPDPRWSQLFADLDGRADRLVGIELLGEVAERTRIEVAQLVLADRLRPAVGQPLDIRCRGAGQLRGRLARVGADWLELAEAIGGATIVPLDSILAVSGLGRWSAAETRHVDRGLRLPSVLRELARRRPAVRVMFVDGGQLTGTVDRVGADFAELAEHPADEARRPGAVRRVWTLPLAGIALVRRPAV